MSALFELAGFIDRDDVTWRLGSLSEANELLSEHHYLGPLHSGGKMIVVGTRYGDPVAAMIWKHPTSRRLPAFGTWLELSRWCLTPNAGENAGSRMHRWSVKLIRQHLPNVTTLVSYSDPSHGHTGALYRACNWQWAPTWHRLRTPPSGNGDWGTGAQSIKDRWVFCTGRDPVRSDVLRIEDAAAIRHWQRNATDVERKWAATSLNLQAVSVDEERFDVVPRKSARVGRDAESIEGHDGNVSPVQSDRPADHGSEHVRGIGLGPIKLHGSHATGSGVA